MGNMGPSKSLFGLMIVAHVALGCKWAPFDPHHVSSLQTQEVVSAAVQILARMDCKGTNGTLVDWIDAGICADYSFPPPAATGSLDALANTTYSACTLADYATGATHCRNKDIVYGDGSQWCHDSARNSSSYDFSKCECHMHAPPLPCGRHCGIGRRLLTKGLHLQLNQSS